MNKPLNIKIILGSTREGRFGDKPAQWIFDIAKQRENLNVELLDLRDYAMPFFAEPVTPSSIKEPYSNPVVQAWTAKIEEADGFIVVSPEYNHGYSAVVKNAFDYVGKQWNKKPVAFVSWGTVGGVRSTEQLRQVVAELQMVSIRTAVHMITPWQFLDEKGLPKAEYLETHKTNANTMLDQLIWWGDALKTARDAS